jgi:hypothetical protein
MTSGIVKQSGSRFCALKHYLLLCVNKRSVMNKGIEWDKDFLFSDECREEDWSVYVFSLDLNFMIMCWGEFLKWKQIFGLWKVLLWSIEVFLVCYRGLWMITLRGLQFSPYLLEEISFIDSANIILDRTWIRVTPDLPFTTWCSFLQMLLSHQTAGWGITT